MYLVNTTLLINLRIIFYMLSRKQANINWNYVKNDV
jgi:hypothetical protein